MLTLIPLYTFHATKLNVNTVIMPFWAAATLLYRHFGRVRSCSPSSDYGRWRGLVKYLVDIHADYCVVLSR
jgi:hypothetical protein